MVGFLHSLLNEKTTGGHAHINDDSYKHEVTITIYDEKNLQTDISFYVPK